MGITRNHIIHILCTNSDREAESTVKAYNCTELKFLSFFLQYCKQQVSSYHPHLHEVTVTLCNSSITRTPFNFIKHFNTLSRVCKHSMVQQVMNQDGSESSRGLESRVDPRPTNVWAQSFTEVSCKFTRLEDEIKSKVFPEIDSEWMQAAGSHICLTESNSRPS